MNFLFLFLAFAYGVVASATWLLLVRYSSIFRFRTWFWVAGFGWFFTPILLFVTLLTKGFDWLENNW